MLTVEVKAQQRQREGSHGVPHDRLLASRSSNDRTSAPARIPAEAAAAAAAAEEQGGAQPPAAADTPFGAAAGAEVPGMARAPSRSMPDTPFAAMASFAREPSSTLPSPPAEADAAGPGSGKQSRKAST